MSNVKITENERRVLNALAAGEILQPYQMRYQNPETLRDRPDAGLHRTCASLVRKGLARRWRKETGVSYSITEAGQTARARANRQKGCRACEDPEHHHNHTCGLKGLQAMLTLPGPRR